MLQTTFGSAAPSDIPQLVGLLALLFTRNPILPNARSKARARRDPPRSLARSHFRRREGGKVVGLASLLYNHQHRRGRKAAWFEDSSCSRNTAARESALGCSST